MSEKNQIKLSDEQKEIFFVELNKIVEDLAKEKAENISADKFDDLLVYPPNGGFTEDEINELRKIEKNDNFKMALRKILADTAASSIFNALCLVDGVADSDDNNWKGVKIVENKENVGDEAFLHDEFFEAYWKWQEKRPDKNWKLDNL